MSASRCPPPNWIFEINSEFIFLIMDFYGTFFALEALYIEPIIHSRIRGVSYICSRSCPVLSDRRAAANLRQIIHSPLWETILGKLSHPRTQQQTRIDLNCQPVGLGQPAPPSESLSPLSYRNSMRILQPIIFCWEDRHRKPNQKNSFYF